MPLYKIHRLKDAQQQHYRWAPQTSGPSLVRPKDYREAGQLEAATPYAAWFELRERATPLRVGDLLECSRGELWICKYVGFEQARWEAPEVPGSGEDDASCPAESRQPPSP